MRSEISLLKHENSALKVKMEPAGASGGKSRVKEEGGNVKLRQRIAQLEMQLKQKVTTVVVLSATVQTSCATCNVSPGLRRGRQKRNGRGLMLRLGSTSSSSRKRWRWFIKKKIRNGRRSAVICRWD